MASSFTCGCASSCPLRFARACSQSIIVMRARASRATCLLLPHDASLESGYRCLRNRSGLPFRDSMSPPRPPTFNVGVVGFQGLEFLQESTFSSHAQEHSLQRTDSTLIARGGGGRFGLTEGNPLFFENTGLKK